MTRLVKLALLAVAFLAATVLLTLAVAPHLGI